MSETAAPTMDIPVHGTLLRVSAEPPRIDPDEAQLQFAIHQRVAHAWHVRRDHKHLRTIVGDDEMSNPGNGTYSRRFVAALVHDVLLNMRRDGLIPLSLLGPLLSTRADDATKLESGRVVEHVLVVDVASLAQGLAGHCAKWSEP